MTTSNPLVVGLDLSLTSTGVALLCGASTIVDRVQPPDSMRDHPRIDYIRSKLASRVRWQDCALAVVEGPSYASPNKQHEMGGLWWIITRMLWRGHIPYAVVTPSGLKKYACGSAGKGIGKDQVLAAAIRRYPMVPVSANDEADALILAAMGVDHLGHPLATVPQTHRAALTAVRWPAIGQTA